MMLLPDDCIKIYSSTTDLFTRLEAHLLRISLLLHLGLAFALALGNDKDILLVVLFNCNLLL